LNENSQLSKINGIEVKDLRAHAQTYGLKNTTKVLQQHTIGEDPEKAFEAGRELFRLEEKQKFDLEQEVKEFRHEREVDRRIQDKEGKSAAKDPQAKKKGRER
jgi:hypothetical protein